MWLDSAGCGAVWAVAGFLSQLVLWQDSVRSRTANSLGEFHHEVAGLAGTVKLKEN